MADIFVSYAKTDRPLASKLVAMLEAEGWKVWWDTSLAIGDDFRNEIMTELGRARAVIVIWTDASVKSDWVRSEAGRAQADRKLIPVKLEHLTYKDLPPPFDVLHTENVGEEDKIRAAVVAQLAKPAVEPTAWALLTKGFKYEVLTWIGIVGGALTLFTNLGAVLKLADWARVLVENWTEWTHAFWLWAFGWLGIHLPPEWTPVLSFLLFGSLLAIGQAVRFHNTIKLQPIADKYRGASFRLISYQTLVYVILLPIVGVLWMLVLDKLKLLSVDDINFLPTDIKHRHIIIAVNSIMIFGVPLGILVLLARDRLSAAVTIFIMLTFWAIIIAGPSAKDDANIAAVGMILLLPLILLSVAPAKDISRRLIFLALGLLLLIALNELSKLGLDVTAPKLQG